MPLGVRRVTNLITRPTRTPVVAARLEDYVNVKLDFTRTSETTKALTEKYQIPGLPVVIFMDADRTVLKRFTGFVDAEEMLGILDDIESGG